MSRPSTDAPSRYKSRGHKVSRSISHKEMWLITDIKTNTGHAINTSDEVIMAMYPVEQERQTERIKYATDKSVVR